MSMTARKSNLGRLKRRETWRRAKRYKFLYIMLLFPLAQYVLFRYMPLSGLQVAFKDYNIFKGMWDSEWVGLDVFKEIFSYQTFWVAMRNTFMLNLLDLLFGFPIPIILAILLYEMGSLRLKRIAQTCLYLPHFLSWIIIGGIVNQIFSSSGFVNVIINALTGHTVNFLMDEFNWVVMYVVSGIWQSAGWGTIVYLAAISGVDTQLYEAAEVDGCGRWRRVWYVTIPCIMPTIVVMLILQLGRMVGIGFERPYVMGNSMVKNVSEVVSTFVYTMGIKNARYAFSTAVGLFGSILNMLFLIAANRITNGLGEGGLW